MYLHGRDGLSLGSARSGRSLIESCLLRQLLLEGGEYTADVEYRHRADVGVGAVHDDLQAAVGVMDRTVVEIVLEDQGDVRRVGAEGLQHTLLTVYECRHREILAGVYLADEPRCGSIPRGIVDGHLDILDLRGQGEAEEHYHHHRHHDEHHEGPRIPENVVELLAHKRHEPFKILHPSHSVIPPFSPARRAF